MLEQKNYSSRQDDDWLSLADLAQRVPYRFDFLMGLIKSGQLKAFKVGDDWFTTLAWFLTYQNQVKSHLEREVAIVSRGKWVKPLPAAPKSQAGFWAWLNRQLAWRWNLGAAWAPLAVVAAVAALAILTPVIDWQKPVSFRFSPSAQKTPVVKVFSGFNRAVYGFPRDLGRQMEAGYWAFLDTALSPVAAAQEKAYNRLLASGHRAAAMARGILTGPGAGQVAGESEAWELPD